MRLTALLFVSAAALAAFAVPSTDDKPYARTPSRAEAELPGKYTVVLHPGASVEEFMNVLQRDVILSQRSRPRPAYSANAPYQVGDQAFVSADIPAEYKDRVEGMPGVKGVYPQVQVRDLQQPEPAPTPLPPGATNRQDNPPSWGLARVSNENLPAAGAPYVYPATAGQGATVFVLDTGVRVTHRDFNTTAGSRATFGFRSQPSWRETDTNGHGTHCAGTIGGDQFGVAKLTKIVAVKVLGDNGSGTDETVIAGLEYVVKQVKDNKTVVASMSLGGPKTQALNDAVAAATRAGVLVVAAAGNDGGDACEVSPASEPLALTVGSTTRSDGLSSFSNRGGCVDILAPGSSIRSAWSTSDTASQTISGTSMAAPHIAGLAALVLAEEPNLTPAQVTEKLLARASKDKISGVPAGTANLLGFNGVPNNRTPRN